MSVVFYGVSFWYCKKRFGLYLILGSIEVIVHAVLATLVLGWMSGFELYLFALCPIIFYFDYLYEKKKKASFFPILFSLALCLIVIGASGYQALYIEPFQFEFPWIIPAILSINVMITFGFMTYFMYLFHVLAIERESVIRHQATIDGLTQLFNRNHMYTIIDQSYMTALEGNAIQDNCFFLALLDIDNFKMINDQFGHIIGDKVLQETGLIIQKHFSQEIYPARWGGEEFIIFAPQGADYNHFLSLLEKTLEEVRNIQFENEKSFSGISFTCGVVTSDYSRSIDEVINDADILLYKGKDNGKNQIVTVR